MRPPGSARGIRIRAALAAALALVLFFEVNHLSCRRHAAADWSRGAVFTLSGATVSLVRKLDRAVTITALVSEGLEAEGLGRSEILRRVLERYAEAGEHVAVRFVDPDREPAAFAEVVRRHRFLLARSAEGPAALEQGVIVEAGRRAAYRTLDDLLPPPAEDARGSSLPVAVEAGITSAIQEATDEHRAVVCLTTGHGEWDLAGPEALQVLRAELEGAAFAVRSVEPPASSDLERCSVLVVGGPSRSFLPREAQRLRESLERGGRFLLLLDAAAAGGAAAGLGPLLARAGIEASGAPARETDPERMYDPGVPTLVVGEIAASFERTRPLAGRPVALLQAAGLRATGPASPARTLVEAAESTAVEGWGGGPALAMAAEIGSCDGSGGRCGRLVVFGGSTVLYPPFADRGQTANLAAVLGAVDWLADRPGPPALRPVAAERIRLFLSPGMLRLYWWWLVVVMPLAAAVAGVIVVRGRRRGG